MGNRSPDSKSGIPQLSEWAPIGNEHHAQILKHPETEEQIQKFVVGQIKNENLNTELKVYFLRMNELVCAVRVLHYGYQKTGSICASPEYFVAVTERTKRLSDFSTLSLAEANTILEQAVKGFALLFELFGLFTITSDLIGINSKHEAKVWLNDNFGLNTIDEDPSAAFSQKHQLQNLVSLIKGKISEDQNKDHFGADILAFKKFSGAVAYFDNTVKTAHTSLDATASFPVNTSTLSDSKIVQIEPQPIAQKTPVRITFQSPQRILKSSNRNNNARVVREFVYPPIVQKQAAPRMNLQQRLQTSHSYHNRMQSPSPSLSRVLIHYAPTADLKRSVMISSQNSQGSQRPPQAPPIPKSPLSNRFYEQYHIPVVDSQLIVETVNNISVNMDLSRMKMEGATILESRVITHP